MVTESTIKMKISWAITGIVILALATTVIIQNRHIRSLTGVENIDSREDAEKYKAEIDKLKSQIADMQAWQDYLEGALNENNKGSNTAPQNIPAENGNRVVDNAPRILNNPNLRDGVRLAMSSRYDALSEEIGLSEETKAKLMDLLAEMQLEIRNRMPGRGGFPPDMPDRESLRQQVEEISSIYEKKLSEILSDDELYAFREYQSSEQERMLITGFNNIFEEDNPLDKETEKELVAAMYSARQADPDTKREEGSLTLLGGPFGRGPMSVGIENSEKLNSVYLESARDILSEDEMQKFENYLTARQSAFNMRRILPPDRVQGAE